MIIKEIVDREGWRQFDDLPFSIYRDDPAWVGPLLSEQKRSLDRKKNPYFSHCQYKAWIVMEERLPVGRILAYIDEHHNEYYQAQAGFIGFFESINQQSVAELLFDTCAAWLRKSGARMMCGPVNFSIGSECGVQLTGFEFPPVIQMNHTPPYYSALFERAGFSKEHDLYAYRMTADEVRRQEEFLVRLEKLGNRALEKEGISMRVIDFRNYTRELNTINNLYNECMRSNWGFVPSGFEEMQYANASLRQIADKRLIFFAERNGETVGCSIGIPDINQALRYVKKGRLFPFGFIGLLYGLRKINGFRLLFLCIKPDHRFMGLDALFYYHTMRKAVENGYKAAELSWISEDNRNLIKIVEKIGAERYKTYRIYRKALS